MGIFSKKQTKETKEPVAAKVEAQVKATSQKEEAKTTAQPVVKKETATKKSSMKELYAKESKATKVVKKEGGKIVTKQVKYNQAYKILKRPLVTEKGNDLNVLGKYLFEVSLKANKVEIAKAINEVYGVMPAKVNIVKLQGKKVRRGRITGKRKDWKKAIITLPKGKTINVYEGV